VIRKLKVQERALKLRITIDGKAYEVDVEILDAAESAPEYPPYPPAPAAYVPAEIPAPLVEPGTAETHNSEKECRSPVTGMVISIDAAPGQAVEANQVVMVLESMKMEMQITAPQAAVIKSVQVIPGSSVKVNQLLVEFE
jgi:methylmalonyl-CoA carboxyltransferase small subunit